MLPRHSSERPWGVLVVDDSLGSLQPLLDFLRNSGYKAAGALNADTALSLIRTVRFDVMVAGVRPGSESGLNLVRLAREQQPAMGVIAITAFPDRSVEQECIRLGVSYLLKPVDLAPFLRIVEKVGDLSRRRRWSRKNIQGGLPASVGRARARVVDMSYGGLRLETPQPLDKTLSTPFKVRLPSLGVSVKATLVWTRPSEPTGPWTYGAVIRETNESATRAWRGVVDALPDESSEMSVGM
jgi:CheY-like chemotaxis protein